MEVIDRILDESNVLKALQHVISNGGASGVDSMRVEALTGYMGEHYADIKASIRKREY